MRKKGIILSLTNCDKRASNNASESKDAKLLEWGLSCTGGLVIVHREAIADAAAGTEDAEDAVETLIAASAWSPTTDVEIESVSDRLRLGDAGRESRDGPGALGRNLHDA